MLFVPALEYEILKVGEKKGNLLSGFMVQSGSALRPMRSRNIYQEEQSITLKVFLTFISQKNFLSKLYVSFFIEIFCLLNGLTMFTRTRRIYIEKSYPDLFLSISDV